MAGRPFSQLRTWPRKKRRECQCRAKDLARTANLQSFCMEKQEMASLSTSFFRLYLPWPSHISAEDGQYVWAVVDIDFFLRFVSRAEIVAFFCRGRIPNSSPVRSGTFIIRHWEKNCSFPQNSGAHFLFIRSVFSVLKKCRCQRFDSYKSEKSSLRADQERAIIYLRKQRRGSSSHRSGFTFGPTQCCRYHRPTHLQFRPNQLLKRETERLFIFN